MGYYQAQGYQVALDDLGSGFADLAALATYLEAAELHSIRPLAEGVGTQTEVDYVRQVGIDLVQRFGLGRPQVVPATTVLKPAF